MGPRGTLLCAAAAAATAARANPPYTQFVTLAFWDSSLPNGSTCGGSPVMFNDFPVEYGNSTCYAWPGQSGANSAGKFECTAGGGFAYTQYPGSSVCNDSLLPGGNRKEDPGGASCTQDFPPILFARVVDTCGCDGSCARAPRPPPAIGYCYLKESAGPRVAKTGATTLLPGTPEGLNCTVVADTDVDAGGAYFGNAGTSREACCGACAARPGTCKAAVWVPEV